MADLTEPDEDRISKRAGALLDQFRDMVYPTWYDPEKSGTKRKVESPTACIVFLAGYQQAVDDGSYCQSIQPVLPTSGHQCS